MKKNKYLPLTIVVILVGSIFLIPFFYGIYRHEKMVEHIIGVHCDIGSCNELNTKDWFFTEYTSENLNIYIGTSDGGREILRRFENTRHGALERFANDEQAGMSLPTLIDKLKLTNPQIDFTMLDRDFEKYANCYEYTQAYLVSGLDEAIPKQTWACVFDPNGIKDRATYMDLITSVKGWGVQ